MVLLNGLHSIGATLEYNICGACNGKRKTLNGDRSAISILSKIRISFVIDKINGKSIDEKTYPMSDLSDHSALPPSSSARSR